MALTPFMNLNLPTVSGTPGPTYATLMNQAVSNNGGDIDSHDHSPGKGKLVPVAGLSINGNLPMGSNSLTQIKDLQLLPGVGAGGSGQSTALSTLSMDSNGNLYVNDNAGNQIAMTSGGAALGGTASNGITGSGYGSGGVTIAWVGGSKAYQLLQAATTFALLQTGPVHIFDTAAGLSNSVNLLSPVSLASSYSLVFPATIPTNTTGLVTVTTSGSTGTLSFTGVQSPVGSAFVVVNGSGVPSASPASAVASGNVSVPTISSGGSIAYAQLDTASPASLEVASGLLRVKAGGITQALRVALTSGSPSAGSGTFTNSTNSYTTAITTGTIATTGRWVTVVLQPTSASLGGALEASAGAANFQIVRDGSTVLSVWSVAAGELGKGVTVLDTGVSAGSHTYSLQCKNGGSGTATVFNMTIAALEN